MQRKLHRLWDLLRLVIDNPDYNGGKKRFLKHLARKWDIELSALPVLESAARLLPEIAKKREELSNSDMPHREAVAKLAELDAEEKEVREQLEKLGVSVYRTDAATEESTEAKDGWPAWDLKDEVNYQVRQIGQGISNVFTGIANGLNRLAAKL